MLGGSSSRLAITLCHILVLGFIVYSYNLLSQNSRPIIFWSALIICVLIILTSFIFFIIDLYSVLSFLLYDHYYYCYLSYGRCYHAVFPILSSLREVLFDTLFFISFFLPSLLFLLLFIGSLFFLSYFILVVIIIIISFYRVRIIFSPPSSCSHH